MLRLHQKLFMVLFSFLNNRDFVITYGKKFSIRMYDMNSEFYIESIYQTGKRAKGPKTKITVKLLK